MNVIELLKKSQLELTHLNSSNAVLMRDISRVLTTYNTGKKYVMCIDKGTGNYNDGLTVGKIYEVTRESDTQFAVGDNYARIIHHPKELFLAV